MYQTLRECVGLNVVAFETGDQFGIKVMHADLAGISLVTGFDPAWWLHWTRARLRNESSWLNGGLVTMAAKSPGGRSVRKSQLSRSLATTTRPSLRIASASRPSPAAGSHMRPVGNRGNTSAISAPVRQGGV